MFRIIQEIRPTWVVGENVENAVRIVIDDIIDNLENIDYETQTFIVSAYCTGAYFDGKRIFIVATPNDWGAAVRRDSQFQSDEEIKGSWNYNGRGKAKFDTGKRRPLESRPYGVADGISDRVDRNNALGNAVRPQQIYPILKAIMRIENNKET